MSVFLPFELRVHLQFAHDGWTPSQILIYVALLNLYFNLLYIFENNYVIYTATLITLIHLEVTTINNIVRQIPIKPTLQNIDM